MKKLLISILRLLRIYTHKAEDKVSELITLQDQILLLQNTLNSKTKDLESKLKSSCIKLEASKITLVEAMNNVVLLESSKIKTGTLGIKEDFMQCVELLQLAIPKQEMAQQRFDLFDAQVNNLKHTLKEFKAESDQLSLSLSKLEHEADMHQLSLEMGEVIYGTDSLSPTYLEIKNKVDEIKAKDLGTQHYNKLTHTPTPEQLERKIKTVTNAIDYEAEFLSLSTTGRLPTPSQEPIKVKACSIFEQSSV